MKKFCICCGKYYRLLPCDGRGIYYGYKVCKTCGRPTEEELKKIEEEEKQAETED